MTHSLHPLLRYYLSRAGLSETVWPGDAAAWQTTLAALNDLVTRLTSGREVVETAALPLRAEPGALVAASAQSLLDDLRYQLEAEIESRQQAEDQRRTSELNYWELFVAARWQTLELTLLDRVRQAVAREVELPALFRTVVTAIVDTFGYHHVSLYLKQGEALYLQHQVGYTEPLHVIPITQGISGRVVRTGQPILLEDAGRDPDFLAAAPDLASEVCVPLFDQGEVVGVLNIESTGETRLAERDLNLMIALSDQIHIGIERARLYAKVRESEARTRRLLEAIPDMLLRIQRDGSYIEIKPATDLVPAQPTTYIGKRVTDLAPPASARLIMERLETTLATGHPQTLEYQVRLGNTLHDFEARFIAFAQNEALVIVRDVTERNALARHAFDLEMERERRLVHVRFIRDASHEFRTPLSTIKTNLSLLQIESDLGQQRRLLDQIDRQTDGILRLVEALVTMSQLDSEITFELELLDLNQTLEEIATALHLDSGEHQVTLELAAGLPPVLADRWWLRQGLQPLIDNAVRYTPPGGHIRLRTFAEKAALVFDIHDTGSGISAEMGLQVFQRFFRADTAHTTAGFGLGLSISKGVIERLGGQITLTSQPGQGTHVRVRLPIYQPPAGSL